MLHSLWFCSWGPCPPEQQQFLCPLYSGLKRQTSIVRDVNRTIATQSTHRRSTSATSEYRNVNYMTRLSTTVTWLASWMCIVLVLFASLWCSALLSGSEPLLGSRSGKVWQVLCVIHRYKLRSILRKKARRRYVVCPPLSNCVGRFFPLGDEWYILEECPEDLHVGGHIACLHVHCRNPHVAALTLPHPNQKA